MTRTRQFLSLLVCFGVFLSQPAYSQNTPPQTTEDIQREIIEDLQKDSLILRTQLTQSLNEQKQLNDDLIKLEKLNDKLIKGAMDILLEALALSQIEARSTWQIMAATRARDKLTKENAEPSAEVKRKIETYEKAIKNCNKNLNELEKVRPTDPKILRDYKSWVKTRVSELDYEYDLRKKVMKTYNEQKVEIEALKKRIAELESDR